MPIQRRHALAALALNAAVPTWALAQAPARLRVAGVYTVPVAQPWVGRIDAALNAAAARGDIDYTVVDHVPAADYADALRKQVAAGVRLVVGESFGLEAEVRKLARGFPGTMFLMASDGRQQAPNYNVFDDFIHEAAFLAGMVAAGISASGRIGLVGGFPIPSVNRVMNAFMAGALDVNPRAVFTVRFIDSWFDPPAARQAALEMIDRGADLLFAERQGVAEAAQERRVLAVGHIVDLQLQFPDTVVTSALWHLEPTMAAAIRAAAVGRPSAAQSYRRFSTLRHKGCSLAPLRAFEARVPPAVLQAVQARAAAIETGRFVVRMNSARPRSTAR